MSHYAGIDVSLELSSIPTWRRQGLIARLQRRTALATTLVAGLELSLEGAVALTQDVEFGEIRVAVTAWG